VLARETWQSPRHSALLKHVGRVDDHSSQDLNAFRYAANDTAAAADLLLATAGINPNARGMLGPYSYCLGNKQLLTWTRSPY